MGYSTYSSLSILVINKDHKEHQRILEILSKPGIKAYSSFNKTETFGLIEAHDPDIIILAHDLLKKSHQNIYQHSRLSPNSPHFIITAIDASEYPTVVANQNWNADLSIAITLEEIARKVAELQKNRHRDKSLVQQREVHTRTSKRPNVSVVIPTLNEAKNLPYLIPYLPMEWIDEVILVDGLSTDNTIQVAKRLLPSIIVVKEKSPGKGSAMQKGFKSSTGDIIITLDADGSNDPREIPRMITALLEGADMVKGTRFSPGGGTNDMTLVRQVGNKGLIFLTNILFGASFSDLCYGYHAFWRHCLDYLDLTKLTGFEIDTGMYIQAWRKNLRLAEIPSFEGYRFLGTGKLQTFNDGWRVLKQIISEKLAQSHEKLPEEYLGFRGSTPQYLQGPAYNNSNGTYNKFAYLNNLFLQKNEVVPSANGYIDSVSFESVRALFQTLYLASSVVRFEYFVTDKLLANILELVVNILEATSGSIVVLDKNGEPSDSYMLYNRKVHQVPISQLVDTFEKGLAGWVIKNQQPVLLSNTSEDDRWIKRSWEDANQNPRSALSVPLTSNNSVVGVLTLARSEAKQFTFNDLIVANRITV